jgi:predicted CXXCH cytochrome family protein
MWKKEWNTAMILTMAVIMVMGCSHAYVHKKSAGTFTVHTFPDGPCHLCHRGSGVIIGSENLLAPGEKLCFRCHSLRKKKYVHRAIELWACAICHNPHGTAYPFLLKDPVPHLCFGCHVENDIRAMEAHKDLRQQCTDCHNPHMSDNKFLLK